MSRHSTAAARLRDPARSSSRHVLTRIAALVARGPTDRHPDGELWESGRRSCRTTWSAALRPPPCSGRRGPGGMLGVPAIRRRYRALALLPPSAAQLPRDATRTATRRNAHRRASVVTARPVAASHPWCCTGLRSV